MPEFTDLKAWMPACWKVFWNEDPAALIVPLPEDAADGELDPEVDVLVVLDELDDEHAARPIAMTASPAVVTCCLRRFCISGTPYRVYRFLRSEEHTSELQ